MPCILVRKPLYKSHFPFNFVNCKREMRFIFFMKNDNLIVWFVVLWGLICLPYTSYSQYNCSFTQYTFDNGLSQNTITAIMKDSKGYLWLGTRDGLNKFDGYNFKIFNSVSDKDFAVLSNRIRTIKEDSLKFIWIKTYDDIVYRLNPSTEKFTSVKDEKGLPVTDKINEIVILQNGKVWLTTYDNGSYEAINQERNQDMFVRHINKENNFLPNNKVQLIAGDADNNTWILTDKGVALFNPSGNKKFYFESLPFYSFEETEKRIFFGSMGKVFKYEKKTKTFETITLQNPVPVVDIAVFSPNSFLFATLGDGFYTYDALRNQTVQYSVKKYPELKTDYIQNLYVDRVGESWMGISNYPGVIHFNPDTQKAEYMESELNDGQVSNPNYIIFEDERDILWIQPFLGSFAHYDRKKNKLVKFASDTHSDMNALFSYGLNHIFPDTQGIFWMSTNRGNGIYKCMFLPQYFEHYLFLNNSLFNIANEVRNVFQDKEKRIWVATKDGKLHIFDENRQLLGLLDKSGKISNSNPLNILVYDICQDFSGNIWLATKKQGIYKLTPSKGKNEFRFENFTSKKGDIYSPASDDFYSILQDKTGNIWAGSYGAGLHLLQENNGKIRFIHSKNELKGYPISNCSRVRNLYSDSHGNIWVGTTEGLVVLNEKFESPEKIKFDYCKKEDDNQDSLGANDVHCIFEDNASNIWIGTFGGGLNKLKGKYVSGKTACFEKYNQAKGFPNNIIFTILQDKEGYLWLTTEGSIVKFDPQNANVESFGKNNELENVEFSEGSAYLLQSGEICLGSKSGLYFFIPENVKRRMVYSPLVFTRFQLFNKDVKIGGEDSPLQRHIDETQKITLNHKQNVFSLEYAALDMRTPESTQYTYKMEGFDADWNYVNNKRFATYTSLPPGNYTFRVKSTDSEGVWLDNERMLEIRILPSFWESVWAKILYVVLGLSLFGVALFVLITIYRLRNNIEVEKKINDMKLRFFTDISHELRTPLTLISLPVDNILADENLKPDLREQLTIVRRNADRVMRLINQILDFRKAQNNKMRLKIEETDFGQFVRSCSEDFIEIAIEKNIKFDIIDESNGVKIWADKDRLDSIISNLLSNAFKFTMPGKNIIMKTSATQNEAILSVIDEGEGIAYDKIPAIFDRFFSTQSFINVTQKSTGIGLNLVKKLVDLHKATISVESELGKGSKFEVHFPLGVSHFDRDVDVTLSDENIPSEGFHDESNLSDSFEHNLPLVLIVEDNNELRHFLKSCLKQKYRIEEAENGLVAWKKAEKLIPDFVISDLIMPEMDGLKLTEKIKNDERTSHIPVILLTAVTDMDAKLEGMKVGVDDYITKPFSSAFLNARVENLMSQRTKLQMLYRSQILSPKSEFVLPPLDIQSQEEAFIQKLMRIMNENIENCDLNIDFLASELGMSRTVFFNKLKSLTGYSPVEFVREVRIERAAEYIKNTQLTFSEISYKVGIEDPRYFSRCFKQKFGVTPSEYRQKSE